MFDMEGNIMTKKNIDAIYENVSQDIKDMVDLGFYSKEEVCGVECEPWKPYIKSIPWCMDDDALKYYKNLRNRVYNYVCQFKDGKCGENTVCIESSKYGTGFKHAYELNLDVCTKEDKVVKHKGCIMKKMSIKDKFNQLSSRVKATVTTAVILPIVIIFVGIGVVFPVFTAFCLIAGIIWTTAYILYD
jgi:hypothetical protein